MDSKKERVYIAIDLKSFYASVECAERHMDPLTTNLVVADESRTEKTICLAVSPSLKAHKIAGRARLFEVIQRVKEVNKERLSAGIKSGAIKRNPETHPFTQAFLNLDSFLHRQVFVLFGVFSLGHLCGLLSGVFPV